MTQFEGQGQTIHHGSRSKPESSRDLSPSVQTASESTSDNDMGERPVREKLKKASLASMCGQLGQPALEQQREGTDVPSPVTAASRAASEIRSAGKEETRGRPIKKRSFDELDPAEKDHVAPPEEGVDYTNGQGRKRSRDVRADVTLKAGDRPPVTSSLSEELDCGPASLGGLDAANRDVPFERPSEVPHKKDISVSTQKNHERSPVKRQTSKPLEGGTPEPEQEARPVEKKTDADQDMGEGATSPRKKRSRDLLDTELDREQKIAATEELRAQRLSSEVDRSEVAAFGEKMSTPSETLDLVQRQDNEQSERPKEHLKSVFGSKSPLSSPAQPPSASSPSKPSQHQITSPPAFASSGFAALASSSASPFNAIGAAPTSNIGPFDAASANGLGTSNDHPRASKTPEPTPTGGFGSFANAPISGFGKAEPSPFAAAAEANLGAFGGSVFSRAFGEGFAPSGKLNTFTGPKGDARIGSNGALKPIGSPEHHDEGDGGNSDSEANEDNVISNHDREDEVDQRFQHQDVETGEDGEESLFSARASLYSFKGAWKESGKGIFKFNVAAPSAEEPQGSAKTGRFIMRAHQTFRVLLNAPVFKGMKVGDSKGNEPSGKSFAFAVIEDGKPMPHMVKFWDEDRNMPTAISPPRTLYDKVLQDHIVDERDDGTILLYIDRHLVHEVTSPQAFEGLRNAKRRVRRPDCTLATTDHNVPTTPRKNFQNVGQFVEEADSRIQCLTLEENVKIFDLTYFGMGDKRQGIVHIIGPEQGFTLPGTTVVCGDSHTSTHGAFGALAFGIGTSEVEHVLATQTLITKRSKNMRVQVDGALAPGVSSKDIILHVIGVIGTAGGTGAVIEFCGSAIRGLSMEGRLSICNMSIEAGARAGMIAPDETTFKYLEGRPLAPRVDSVEWKKATRYWSSLGSDPGANYDRDIFINAHDIIPTVSWGTSPQDVVPITGVVPNPDDFPTEAAKIAARRALEYMGLAPGTRMEDIELDKIFIGSCTNARIEDLRAAARIVEGKIIAPNLKRAMIVPGSGLVKKQAESENLDKIFINAGFEWREAGCSMCLGMNPDTLSPKERCASTSNRNFEGRQGSGGRTHLMSPVMAAAAALRGKLADVRKLTNRNATPAKASPKLELTPEPSYIDAKDDMDRLLDIPEANQPITNSDTASSSGGQPKFTTVKGIAAPMEMSNVDTDAIIPKQFLKTIKRTGLGSALFYALRFNEDGSEKADFVLNKEPYRNAKILVVTGPNFGCGSSREHAPWALLDFGITCIIASSFADIFFNNTFKNGMLPLVIEDQSKLEKVAAEARAGREIEIDLINQQVKDTSGNKLAGFSVEEFRKHCLVNGLDDIGLTMQMESKIKKFECRRTAETPWLNGSGYLKRGERVGPTNIEAAPALKINRGQDINQPLEW
ncbi:MAG: hypothetical protein Q9217_000562 [Psora testacea]